MILLHGAAVSGFMLHSLALQAQAAGLTVYVPDLRGHGGSGEAGARGDIAYRGQLLDDLADLAHKVHAAQPAATLSLLGHSAGGCLALQFAGGTDGALFDRYVLVSPMLARDAPTVRAGVGGFVQPFKGRYVALTVLDRFGVHALEGLPVLAFAVPEAPDGKTTPLYSYRLAESFTQDRNYRADLAAIRKPVTVLVGANDEFFYPDRFAPLVHALRPDIAVSVVPGAGHVGIVMEPAAMRAVVVALGGPESR